MPDYSDTRLQFRRGTYAEWAAANPILASGEPGYDTTNKILKVGDGTTQFASLSGISGGGGGGGGGSTTFTGLLDSPANYSSSAGKYLMVNGAASAIEFNTLDVVDDTTPQLGGDLDLNSNDITGTTSSITAQTFVKHGGTSSQFLKADGSVDSNSYLTSVSALSNIVEDTTPQLGGELDAQGNDITTVGNISATGNITSDADIDATGTITGTSIIKSGGTSSQFLKADGSVDSSTYLTSYTETDTLANVTGRGATTTTTSVIPFYYANQSAFPNATTYHGAIAHSHSDGAMYFAHGGVWNKLANSSDISNSSNWDTAYGWGDHGTAGYLTSIADITVSNFAAATIVTESEDISSNDNDTTIPTSAAVKDYVDNNGGGGTSDVVDDTTPQLGGTLDTNSQDITGGVRADTIGIDLDSAITGGTPLQVYDLADTQPFFAVRAGSAFISAIFGPSSGGSNNRIHYYSSNTTTGNYWRQDASESTYSLTRVDGNVADDTVFSIVNSGATFNENLDVLGALSCSGTLGVGGTLTATTLVKSGGTSSQFLKADGSVDTNTYLTDHQNISAASSSSSNTGNTFIQNLTLDSNGHITALTTGTASSGGSGGIGNVVEDTTPQLGGDLDAQSNDISSVGTITATSLVKSGGASSEFLKADGSVDSNTYSTTDTQLTEEQVEDFVGGMVSGSGLQTGITVTYDDSDGTLDFVVASQTDENFTTADHSKLDGIEAGADITDTANVVAALSSGTGVSISASGVISVSSLALTTVQTASDETAHLALTAEEGDVVVRSDENKSYVHNGGSAGTMSDYTLLLTPTDAVLSVAGNTGAVTAAQIKTAYEGESNTNAFTDADHSKLDGIEASADVTDTANVTAAGALMDSEITNLAQVKAFDASDYLTSETFTSVVQDTTPQLGGTLDAQSNNITGVGTLGVNGGATFEKSLIVNNAGSATSSDFQVKGDNDTHLLFTDAANDKVGIGTATPAHKLDVAGMGRFVHADGACGLQVEDTGGSGLHIGDCALDASSAYAGIKHSNHGVSDYMMISNGVTTFLSAVNNGAVILRGGGNDSNSEIQVKDVGVGGVGIIFNEAGADRDIRMEGAGNTNLFRLDASTDRIGIGTATPAQVLDVSTVETEIAGFNGQTSSDPVASGNLQSLIIESKSGAGAKGIYLKHMCNESNGSSALSMKNVIRMGEGIISLDDAYTTGLSTTYYPKLQVNTETGAVTFNDTYTFPTADGTANQVLQTDGAGNISFGTLSTTNLDTTNFSAATIVTEAEGIGSNDNDTTLPTSAAVKDYADTKVASDTSAVSNSVAVNNVVMITQTNYNALSSYDANTLYFIIS